MPKKEKEQEKEQKEAFMKTFTMPFSVRLSLVSTIVIFMTGCNEQQTQVSTESASSATKQLSQDTNITPESWPALKALPLDPKIEARIDEILPKLTLKQKVGQVIQGDSSSLTPEDVKTYRLGSVLSGGNSAPGPLPYAKTGDWLEMADKYYLASVDAEGVEIAIPTIWGIDAVHGHANLTGAIVFPHNIGLGAMRNPDLMEEIAKVTAHELTVSGHDWTFAPTLAVPQNTTWGRTYEGYSEDPSIVSAYADRIVYGLQGRPSDEKFMGEGRVISSAKHYVGDGGTTNGVDQGDANITEASLRDTHAAGYYTAIPAGVQTVMASYSSWRGSKLHGDKQLLTDVLKGQMNFNGFVVGDWNGHGQIPGCTNTDCPQSLNAGLDMYMAPDSWKGLYHSTLKHAQEGTIPISRLDDAVRRILRVKLASGIFEKGLPSARANAGNLAMLGLTEHRAIARQAVRESLVLLKNDGRVLPLNASKTIMVVGDGADNIAKPAGGWTLSWQGGVKDNAEFPHSQTILAGIKEAVAAAGGKVIFSPKGDSKQKADVIIAIYGEDPYAEFQGDRDNLDFVPNEFDTTKLTSLAEDGTPIVSVFLSGRPMWTNPEINASDAFVAAWLPGSEGGGVADLLFQAKSDFDFTGTLPFSWPNTAAAPMVDKSKDKPLFKLGYGLTYQSGSTSSAPLSEKSGLENSGIVSVDQFFNKGILYNPWSLSLSNQPGDLTKTAASFPTSIGDLILSKTDYQAQEDMLRLNWSSEPGGEKLRVQTAKPVDMTRESVSSMELAFVAKTFNGQAMLNIGMGCGSNPSCDHTLPIAIADNDWAEYRIGLSCFADKGVDMAAITTAFFVSAASGTEVGLGNIRLETNTNAKVNCKGVQ